MTKQTKRIKLQLIRSLHGRVARQQATAHGLGLRKINQVVEVEDTPCNRGMIEKINFMLKEVE